MKREWGKKGNNRGQVTIFIIIAVLIIAVVSLVYFLMPETVTEAGFDVQNPRAFIQDCLEDKVQEVVSTASIQGGSISPEFYFNYLGEKVEYLCYTNEYYKTCVVQQPFLKQHIESEIKDAITTDVETCFANLKTNYEAEGYSATLQAGRIEVELLPKRVAVNFNDYILTATKGDTSRYEEFGVVLNNNLYELVSIANSIVEWESNYGDAETTIYMNYYKDLKVEKKVQQDGTTIYILTDRNTENKFQFASRSVAWPPGYGTSGIST